MNRANPQTLTVGVNSITVIICGLLGQMDGQRRKYALQKQGIETQLCTRGGHLTSTVVETLSVRRRPSVFAEDRIITQDVKLRARARTAKAIINTIRHTTGKDFKRAISFSILTNFGKII